MPLLENASQALSIWLLRYLQAREKEIYPQLGTFGFCRYTKPNIKTKRAYFLVSAKKGKFKSK